LEPLHSLPLDGQGYNPSRLPTLWLLEVVAVAVVLVAVVAAVVC
jgi:hypothetical protein